MAAPMKSCEFCCKYIRDRHYRTINSKTTRGQFCNVFARVGITLSDGYMCSSCVNKMTRVEKLDKDVDVKVEQLIRKREQLIGAIRNLPGVIFQKRKPFTYGGGFDNFKEVFENPNHQKRIANKLFELWKEEKFCDAALSIGSQKVHIHKCILVANCPYVLKQCQQQNTYSFLDVQIPPDVLMEGVNAFVEYLYVGVLRLTSSNVLSVEKIAFSLEMKEVYDFCSKFKNLIAEKAQSPINSLTSSSINIVFACDRTKMFCLSGEDGNRDISPDNDSSMVPTVDFSESYGSVNIKQEPLDEADDNCDEATSYNTDSTTKDKSENSETVRCIKNSDHTEVTQTKISNSYTSSDNTTDICPLEMEVECKEEPQEFVTHNESHEQSVCNFIEPTSHVETLATASADVGTTVQSAGSQVKKEIVMGSQQVILAAPLIGNNVVTWSPVVNSPKVLNTSTTSPQAVTSCLPTTTLPVNMPYNFQIISNILKKQSSKKQPNKTEQPRSILPKKT